MICLKNSAVGWLFLHIVGILLHGLLIKKFLQLDDRFECFEAQENMEMQLSENQGENFFGLKFHDLLCDEINKILPEWTSTSNFSSASIEIMEDFYFRNCSKSAMEEIMSGKNVEFTNYENMRDFGRMYNILLEKLEMSKDSFSKQQVTMTGQELADLIVRQTRIVFIELQKVKKNCRNQLSSSAIFYYIIGFAKIPEASLKSTVFSLLSLFMRIINSYTFIKLMCSTVNLNETFSQRITARFKISRWSYSAAVFILTASFCLFLPALVASHGEKDFLAAFLHIFSFPDFQIDNEIVEKNELLCLEEVLHPIHDNNTLGRIYEHCFSNLEQNRSAQVGPSCLLNKILLQLFLVCTGSMFIARNFKNEDRQKKNTISREASQSEFTRRSSLNEFSRGTSLI